MSNADMIEAWDGPTGEKWVEDAERYDRLNRRFGERVVDRVAAQPGERVLDIGCGNGAVALVLAPHVGPDGAVVGVDISGPMLGKARQRVDEAGAANVEFVKADAQVHVFKPQSFDAAVSRFGVMFFDDLVAAFANIRAALRPGGRLVFCCWQDRLDNEWIMVPVSAALAHIPFPELGLPNAPGPFALADHDRTSAVLADAGFVDIVIEDVYEPMRLGESAPDVVEFFMRTELATTLFKDVPQPQVDAALAAMAEALAPYDTQDGVVMQGAAWLVTARAP